MFCPSLWPPGRPRPPPVLPCNTAGRQAELVPPKACRCCLATPSGDRRNSFRRKPAGVASRHRRATGGTRSAESLPVLPRDTVGRQAELVPPKARARGVRGLIRRPAGSGLCGCLRGECLPRRAFRRSWLRLSVRWHRGATGHGSCRWVRAPEADRAISTGQLRGLPRFHLRPIDVMVSHGSRRDLVLREVSRLDAFSGYPVRT